MQLLLVDDHPLFALYLAHALTHAGAGIHVNTASTVNDGLSRAASGSHDLVLIDQRLAGADGIEAIRRFGARFPQMARVVISGDEDAAGGTRARSVDASG